MQIYKQSLIICGILLVAGGIAIWHGNNSLDPLSPDNGGSEPENKSPLEEQPAPTEDPLSESEQQLPQSDTINNNTKLPLQSQKQGELVFAIQNDASALNGIEYLYITIDDIAAYNTTKGWVALFEDPQTYDLVALKLTGKPKRMFTVNTEEGTYSQLRLMINSVVIIKNGMVSAAILPSYTLYMPISFPIKNDKTSAVVLDMIADKSLHKTTDNQYVFAPVLEVTALSEIQDMQESSRQIEFFGGYPKFAARFGMKETGAMEKGSNGIDSLSTIELVRNVFVLIPNSINRARLTVTPAAAMDKALAGYSTHISAVDAITLGTQIAWRVTGVNNGRTIYVYIDGETGEIIKIE